MTFTTQEIKIAKSIASKTFPVNMREDMYNIALTAIWKYRDRYDGERAGYSTFIYTRAKSAVIDEIRRMNGRNGSYKRAAEHCEFDTEYMGGSADNTRAHIQHMDIKDAVSKMNYREKYIVKRLSEGAAKHEIATELNLTAGRISQLLTGVKRKLEPCLS